MIYGAKNRLQGELALYALGVGFLIGLCYALFRLTAGRFLRRKAALFAADAVFCVIASLVTFLFLLDYNGGTVRMYLLAAEAAGFLTARAAAASVTKIFSKNRKKSLHPRGKP